MSEEKEYEKKFNETAKKLNRKAYIVNENGKDILDIPKDTTVVVTSSGRYSTSGKSHPVFIGKYAGVKRKDGKRYFAFVDVLKPTFKQQEDFIAELRKEHGDDEPLLFKLLEPWTVENDNLYRIYHDINEFGNIARIAKAENLPREVTGLLGSYFKLKGREPKGSRHRLYPKEVQEKERERLRKEELEQQEQEALAAMKTGGRKKTKKRLSKNRRHTSRK